MGTTDEKDGGHDATNYWRNPPIAACHQHGDVNPTECFHLHYPNAESCPNCGERGHPKHHVAEVNGTEMFICFGKDTEGLFK